MCQDARKLIQEGGWTRDLLDRDYDARATVGEGFSDEMKAYLSHSDAARAGFQAHEDVVYDPVSGQKLDIFKPDEPGGPFPVFVFIHGGYWRALSKRESAMMAGTLAKAGYATVAIDYALAPDTRLTEILRQVRQSLAFLWNEGKAFNLDAGKIHVGGSSAGAHLAAMTLTTDWQSRFQVPSDLVKSVLLLSGLYELAPIAASFAQDWLALSAADVADLSPLRHLPARSGPVLVAWAEGDAPGFKRQSLGFHEAWKTAGLPGRALEIENCNHFNILLELSRDDSRLTNALVHMMQTA
ncbi:alpha/beta hydrolase [Labrenzia sp. 011]|uniref:alpha/beta hydrolase n=1 Tax=Labrenzia sp. 011 TaxID=2171494 RepID=UPI000D521B93|nr:alpha/beta hydrolase [Labrenzia sp. 011]PVB59890.1 alpha/beta hydrolase [Labrenzia sp. 011]